jgi:hypothetical protein
MLEFINSFITIAKKAELLHPDCENTIWLVYEKNMYPPTTGLKPETSNDSAETDMIVTFHHKLSCSEFREKNGKMNFMNEKPMSSEKHIRNSFKFVNVVWTFKHKLMICLLFLAFVFSEIQLWNNRMDVITCPPICSRISTFSNVCCRCRI